MEHRLTIVFTATSELHGYLEGERGIVDGYCRGANDVLCAVVVNERTGNFVLAPLNHIRLARTVTLND